MSVRFQSISKTPNVVVGVLCLVLAGMLTACGGSTEVVVKVSDEEGSPIAGVSISQVGGSSDLGTTDEDGLVTIVPDVGDDEVEIRLNVPDDKLEVLNPYSITKHHLNSRRRIIRLRQKSDSDMGLTASVQILSNPQGATVTLRGELLGHTPLEQEDLATGMARVELELEGYQPLLIDVALTAGQNAPISVDLVSSDLADGGGDLETAPDGNPDFGTSETPVDETPVDGTPVIDTPPAQGNSEVDALKNEISRHLQTQSWSEAEAALNRLAAIDPGQPNITRWRQAITAGKQEDERRMRISILRSSIPSRLSNQDWAGAQREAKELLRYQPNDMLANQWLRESEENLNAPKDPSPPKDDPNPDRDISNLLQKYEDALEALSVGSYAKLWKSIPNDHKDGVERGFSQMTALKVDLSDINIQRNGGNASVTFTESRTISLRAGSDQSFNRRVELSLVREGGTWLIEKLEGR